MSKLRDHFIICGAGRVGSHLIRSLRAVDGLFVVIESDQRKVEALMDDGIPSELNIVIVSIRRNDGEIIFNPSGETKIEDGDMLIAIGNPESLSRLNALARGRVQERAIEAG